MSEWRDLIDEALARLWIEDPDRAQQLTEALARLEDAEAKLEEVSKRDELDWSRIRSYGVKR
jgi:hypothetical protein